MSTIEDDLVAIDAKIAETQQALADLRAERKVVLSRAEQSYRDIAAILHDTECPSDHIDGCGWGYEWDFDDRTPPTNGGTWAGGDHQRWLGKAIEAVAKSGATPRDYLVALRMVKGMAIEGTSS